jgi:RNA polymerase sigma-70 factor, ECF subfamily
MHEEREERRLLEDLSRGDEAAFWVLWQRHRSHLYAICLSRMSGAPADADDAVSHSMLVARRKLPEFAREIENVKAWLTRMAGNVCIDIRRQQQRRTHAAVPLDDVMAYHPPPHPTPSPEEWCRGEELRALVDRGIGELPAHLREVARLRLLHDADYAEIAGRLSITPENARKRLQQARALLRQRLESEMSA